jgi:hypothetical protein
MNDWWQDTIDDLLFQQLMRNFMKPIVLYHASCADGFGAALAVYLRYLNEFEYVAVQYGEPAPDVTDRHVIIVDFSYKKFELEEMAAKAKSILIIDHHKGAADELKDLPTAYKDNDGAFWEITLQSESPAYPKVSVLFDMERSGAMMAWQFFQSDKEVPALYYYLQDRDLNKNVLPNTHELTAALRLQAFDFDVWRRFVEDGVFQNLIRDGEIALKARRVFIDAAKQRAFLGTFDDDVATIVPIVNCDPSIFTEVVGELAVGYKFAVGFSMGPKNVHISLRSTEDGDDVNEITKRFGGGGHPHAAGFRINYNSDDTPPFEPLFPIQKPASA